MRVPSSRIVLAAALVGAALVSSCSEAKSPPRPNVVLISIDSLRQDLVGAYGFESPFAPGVSPSPAIDRLAAEGVLFANAYSTTSWTLPSHLTMLTGHPELLHGVDIDYHVPDPSRRLLSEHLGAAGYRTAGFFSGPYLEPDFDFARGFDRYEACYGPNLAAASRRKTELAGSIERAQRGEVGLPPVAELQRLLNDANRAVEAESHRDVSSRTVAEAALEELDAAAREGRPFFLFAHLFDPHYDYVPPAPFDRAFDPEYDGAVSGQHFLSDPAVARPHPRATAPGMLERVASERDMQHVRALYAGELAWVDSQVGRILDKLAALGLAENTLVILTSDHGDEFFEHGSLGHRNTLYEEITRIPLLMRWPNHAPAGKRVDALTSTVDLVPTVLDWLQLPGEVTGTSLVPLVAGTRDAADRHVLGRMVRAWNIGLAVPDASGTPQPVPGQLIVVTESYHAGSLKLLRERSWPQASLDGFTPAAARDFKLQQSQAKGRESLRWIDLAIHPDERAEDWSTDFSVGPARAALAAFHERYVALNAERLAALEASGAQSLRDTSAHREMLQAFGYVDGASDEPLPPGEFSLPAPGK